MTNSVTAIAPVDQKPMVHLPNPEPGSDVFLSRAAEAALSKLSQMQADFTRISEANTPTASSGTEVSQGQPVTIEGGQSDVAQLSNSMGDMARSIHASAVVQQQLAQFVVASSVSSSFGRNLNMFLRGQ